MNSPHELSQAVFEAKAAMDNGFSRIGPRLDPADRVDGWLVGAASRCLALSDAIALLCRHHHVNEALPVLRTLALTAAGMRALAAAPSPEKAGALERESQGDGWVPAWSRERLEALLLEGGVASDERDALTRTLEAHAADHRRAGSTGLPWSHSFERNRHEGAAPEDVLGLAVRLLGHALRALDARWHGAFPGAEALWSR